MPSRALNETTLRAAVSVSQMAKMVGLSRASFYEHVRRGTFFPPEYQIGHGRRRPIYTAEIQIKNLDIKATQVGCNGEFVIFYDRKPRDESQRSSAASRHRRETGSVHGDLRRRLEGLGLSNLTDAQVDAAHSACFAQGTVGVSESDVLRVIYRHLRRSDPV
jgi:predicted DNA-binding transcriptional regulator AlpA